jgi:hypothetical protein
LSMYIAYSGDLSLHITSQCSPSHRQHRIDGTEAS